MIKALWICAKTPNTLESGCWLQEVWKPETEANPLDFDCKPCDETEAPDARIPRPPNSKPLTKSRFVTITTPAPGDSNVAAQKSQEPDVKNPEPHFAGLHCPVISVGLRTSESDRLQQKKGDTVSPVADFVNKELKGDFHRFTLYGELQMFRDSFRARFPE